MPHLIDPNNVQQVLLQDDWHAVQPGSFQLETIEFGHYGQDHKWVSTHGPGNTGMAPVGFTFLESDGQRITGSMRYIIAIKEQTTLVPTQLPA